MDDKAAILFGATVLFIGLLILIKFIIIPGIEFIKKKEVKKSKTMYLLTIIITISLYTMYEHNEVRQHANLKSLYAGPISAFFSGLLTFIMVFSIVYIICFIIFYALKKYDSQNKVKIYLFSLVLAVLSVLSYFGGSKNIDSLLCRDRFINKYNVTATEQVNENYKEPNLVQIYLRVEDANIFSLGYWFGGERMSIIDMAKYQNNNLIYVEPGQQNWSTFKKNRVVKLQDNYGHNWEVTIPVIQ